MNKLIKLKSDDDDDDDEEYQEILRKLDKILNNMQISNQEAQTDRIFTIDKQDKMFLPIKYNSCFSFNAEYQLDLLEQIALYDNPQECKICNMGNSHSIDEVPANQMGTNLLFNENLYKFIMLQSCYKIEFNPNNKIVNQQFYSNFEDNNNQHQQVRNSVDLKIACAKLFNQKYYFQDYSGYDDIKNLKPEDQQIYEINQIYNDQKVKIEIPFRCNNCEKKNIGELRIFVNDILNGIKRKIPPKCRLCNNQFQYINQGKNIEDYMDSLYLDEYFYEQIQNTNLYVINRDETKEYLVKWLPEQIQQQNFDEEIPEFTEAIKDGELKEDKMRNFDPETTYHLDLICQFQARTSKYEARNNINNIIETPVRSKFCMHNDLNQIACIEYQTLQKKFEEQDKNPEKQLICPVKYCNVQLNKDEIVIDKDMQELLNKAKFNNIAEKYNQYQFMVQNKNGGQFEFLIDENLQNMEDQKLQILIEYNKKNQQILADKMKESDEMPIAQIKAQYQKIKEYYKNRCTSKDTNAFIQSDFQSRISVEGVTVKHYETISISNVLQISNAQKYIDQIGENELKKLINRRIQLDSQNQHVLDQLKNKFKVDQQYLLRFKKDKDKIQCYSKIGQKPKAKKQSIEIEQSNINSQQKIQIENRNEQVSQYLINLAEQIQDDLDKNGSDSEYDEINQNVFNQNDMSIQEESKYNHENY
ncbi:hypothetical protein PPERSA_07910 [Pseudocohnilembus persalinus]|uniref:Uncharacterized protein n=1 Tax=Pseudocohnilembus persalinus TaxID=266149 RepID=A0A0V0QWV3_PSEPJ|nr:hypothetical protein PPERSA_07910 [Pseudocohnilembus persalinus]|eukprot:KRX06676.1 hypothetical protein PPERSA_07910 [Pseudocohnilembus persalinus]